MTPLELVQYYSKLLILQFVGLPKAFDTIQSTVEPIVMVQQSEQDISFSLVPTSGTFTLSYDAVVTSTLHWNDSASTIQSALRAITGLGSVTVTGSIASKTLTVDFVGVTGVADLLVVNTNTLLATATVVTILITETDQTLPILVQNAFDPATAVGVQLDTIGKYQGVVRSGYSLSGQPITLSDSDFRVLIKFATIVNTEGSSLSDIQDLLNQFFPGEILVFDYQNMHMSYFINSSLGSQDLVQLLIQEHLLPKPMAVQLGVTIYAPTLKFFGMLSAPLVARYATQNSLTITQAANALLTINDIWQFNSTNAQILGEWLSAHQGVV